MLCSMCDCKFHHPFDDDDLTAPFGWEWESPPLCDSGCEAWLEVYRAIWRAHLHEPCADTTCLCYDHTGVRLEPLEGAR